MGRGCHWKETELGEEGRWIVVQMSHGGVREEGKRNPTKTQLYLLVNWVICTTLHVKLSYYQADPTPYGCEIIANTVCL